MKKIMVRLMGWEIQYIRSWWSIIKETDKLNFMHPVVLEKQTNKLTLGMALSVYFIFPPSLLIPWCSIHIHLLVMNAV